MWRKKPEDKTHLEGKSFVSKWNPRVRFRGKLDSLYAVAALTRHELKAAGATPALLADVKEIEGVLRELQRSEPGKRPYERETILGLTMDQLREESHALYDTPPGEGKVYALLNVLRTAVRETELTAVEALGDKREDLVLVLNRLSSAVHILMCRV